MTDPVRKGKNAERILDDDVFQEAVATLDANIIQEWREALTEDARERAHVKQAVLEQLVGELRSIMNDGVFEEDRRESE